MIQYWDISTATCGFVSLTRVCECVCVRVCFEEKEFARG